MSATVLAWAKADWSSSTWNCDSRVERSSTRSREERFKFCSRWALGVEEKRVRNWFRAAFNKGGGEVKDNGVDWETAVPWLAARIWAACVEICDCRGLPVLVRGKSGSGQSSQRRICWKSARVALAAVMARVAASPGFVSAEFRTTTAHGSVFSCASEFAWRMCGMITQSRSGEHTSELQSR